MNEKRDHRVRGVTLIEVMVAIGVLLVLVAIVLPQLGGSGTAKQVRCATNVRTIYQGLAAWATNDGNRYPLPSRADIGDHTMADTGEAKNTTANIFSLLVFQRVLTVDVFVSPMERGNVHVDSDYEFVQPSTAVNPGLAVFDPAFSADFTSEDGGNISYAHLQPSSGRLARWMVNAGTDYPVLSMRGPQVGGVAPNVTVSNPNSITLNRGVWSGNVVRNDNSVVFEDGNRDSLLMFHDDPATPDDVYLGVFIEAGREAKDFRAIWD